MTDRELIDRFVNRRDERAFRQLYALHTPAVYGLLRRLAGPAVDVADDVLQDAWLRAAAAMATFRGESAFRTWLTGIAINCYRERWRRRSATVESVPAGREPTTAPAARAVDVDNILQLLSSEHREVLVLHDVEGYTHEEIADALGIEVGTSKSRLSRARQMFRERWRSEPQKAKVQP
jgi:RNA polymerase sigma-70 factor (ECF subfamily)